MHNLGHLLNCTLDSSREAMSDDPKKDRPDLVHGNTAGADQAFEDIRAQMKRLRCPAQRQAQSRRDRILALGPHYGRSGLPVAHFDSLAADDEVVNCELSDTDGKAVMERSELVKHFTRGAQLLRDLLASIDDALLRP